MGLEMQVERKNVNCQYRPSSVPSPIVIDMLRDTMARDRVPMYTGDINLGQFYSVFTIFCHFST